MNGTQKAPISIGAVVCLALAAAFAVGACLGAPAGAGKARKPSAAWRGDLNQLYFGPRRNSKAQTRLLISYLEQEVSRPSPPSTGLGGAPIDSDYRQAQIIHALSGGDPAVIRAAWRKARTPAVRDGLTICLVWHGDRRLVGAVIGILEGKAGMHVRAKAAFALGMVGGAQALAALSRALHDPASVTFVRREGVGRLGLSVGAQTMVFPVREAARDTLRHLGAKGDLRAKTLALVADAQEAFQVAQGTAPKAPGSQASAADDRLVYLRRELVQTGPPAVGPLLEIPTQPRAWELWDWQQETIRRMGTAAIPALETAFRDHRSAIRERAIRCLAKTGDPAAVGPILAGLKDADRGVRDAAAYALSELASMLAIRQLPPLRSAPRVLPALLEALPDNSAAIGALGSLGDRRATGALLGLFQQLDPKEVDTRAGVISALGELRDPAAIPVLVQAIQSPEERVGRTAAGALRKMGARAATPVAHLLGHGEARVRGSALWVLQEIGVPEEAYPRVSALLDDQDREIRERYAWQTICRMKPDRAVAAVLDCLARRPKGGEESRWMRIQLAAALGYIGSQEAISALVSILNDPEEQASVRGMALLGLVRSKDPGLGRMLSWELLSGIGYDRKRWHGLQTRGVFDLREVVPDAVPLLLKTAERTAHPEVRSMAITSLGRLRDRRAVEPLIRVAKVYWNARGPYEPGLAGASALALGEIGDRRAVPALLKLVTTGKRMDNPLVGRAVIALGKIGDSRARGPLSRLFRQAQPRTWQQRSLAVALGLLGDTGAIPVLKEHLKSTFHGDGWPPACPDYEQTEEAAQALARIGRPAFKVLVDALDWRYKHTTDYVCLALGQLHDGRALRPVIRLLEDPSYRTRHHAALALGELGNPKALPYLRRATRDPSGYVRVGAAEALWRVGERTHLSVLVEVLKNDPEDWAREQAGLALGRLADARAIPALHQALQDPYFAVRQAAREALAILSSRRESKAAH